MKKNIGLTREVRAVLSSMSVVPEAGMGTLWDAITCPCPWYLAQHSSYLCDTRPRWIKPSLEFQRWKMAATFLGLKAITWTIVDKLWDKNQGDSSKTPVNPTLIWYWSDNTLYLQGIINLVYLTDHNGPLNGPFPLKLLVFLVSPWPQTYWGQAKS